MVTARKRKRSTGGSETRTPQRSAKETRQSSSSANSRKRSAAATVSKKKSAPTLAERNAKNNTKGKSPHRSSLSSSKGKFSPKNNKRSNVKTKSPARGRSTKKKSKIATLVKNTSHREKTSDAAKSASPKKKRVKKEKDLFLALYDDDEEEGDKDLSRKELTNKRLSRSSDDRRWEIKYGALEIVGVFFEDGDDDKPKGTNMRNFRFVRLCDDVLYGDDEAEPIKVEWLEDIQDEESADTSKNGVRAKNNSKKGKVSDNKTTKHLLQVLEDEGIDRIPIGSIICAVTDQIIEYIGIYDFDTFEIPQNTWNFVEKQLNKQIADEPTCGEDKGDGDQNENLDYDKRMRKTKRRKVVKVKTDNVLDDDEEGGNDDENKTNARGRKMERKKVAKKAAAQKKGKKKIILMPRPTFVIPSQDIWHKKTGKVNAFGGDTHRASKEPIRAFLSNDKVSLKKILNERNGPSRFVADVFVKQSADVSMTVLDYAIIAEDKTSVMALVEELKECSNSVSARPEFPQCTLLQLSSGRHTSQYADYNRRQVGASRGGLEGNNAFAHDMVGNGYGSKRTFLMQEKEVLDLICLNNPISLDFFQYLDKELFAGNLVDWGFDLNKIVKSGHLVLARHAASLLLDKGVGLNHLHFEALGGKRKKTKTEGDKKKNDTIRAISVTKMTQNGTRFMPIHCAATNPEPSFLQKLLNIAPDAVNCLDTDEGTILHYAAVGDGTSTLRYLLDGPASSLNRNAKLRKGSKSTPLIWAAEAGRAGNVKLLCDGRDAAEIDAMMTAKDSSGMTALHLACSSRRSGRIEVVSALLECGADPNVRGDARLLDRMTPLMICAMKGDLDLIKILVEGGADLLAVDKLGRTPAMMACKNGHVLVLSYLLQVGVGMNDVDSSENAAVHYAAAYGWIECLKILLDLGADPDPKNSWSSTPLALALKKGRYGCAILLLNLDETDEDMKIEMNDDDETGDNAEPLDETKKKKRGVDVNVCDKSGISLFNSLVKSYMEQLKTDNSSPLPWAVKKILDRKDLNVKSTDSSDRTVLHYIADEALPSSSSATPESGAVEEMPLELVEKLLNLGADPLAIDEVGRLPLHLALKRKNMKLCKLLLENVFHGNISLPKESGGRNPIHLLVQGICSCRTDNEEALFLDVLHLLEKCNGKLWMAEPENEGMTPLLLSAESLREGWSVGNATNILAGKRILKKILESMPLTIQKSNVVANYITRERRSEFRTLPSQRIDKEGFPNWKVSDEYAPGSRSILHALVQCPDVVWVEGMFRKVLDHLNDNDKNKMLNLKEGNNGFDVVEYAVKTFVFVGRNTTINTKVRRKGMFDDSDDESEEYTEYESEGSDQESIDELGRAGKGGPVLANSRSLGSSASAKFDTEILKLFKLLYDSGADMDGVTHPLFSSLNEALAGANNFDPRGKPDLCDDSCKLDNAVLYVLQREQARVRKELSCQNNQSTRKLLEPKFQPRLHRLLYNNDFQKSVTLLRGMLACGLSAKGRDLNGNTALHVAVRKKNAEFVKELLRVSAGADVNALNNAGDSPLTLPEVDIKISEILLKHGANTKYVSPSSGTALHVAVKKQNEGLVELMLKSGDSVVNVPDADGRTPLHHAVALGAVSRMEMLNPIESQLLLSGADVNTKDRDGRTPLHYAFFPVATNTRLEFPPSGTESRDPLDMLTTIAGANLNVADKDGRTPLHYAAAAGSTICVLYLCENADREGLLEALDADGNTPLALALRAHQPDTAVMLMSKGSVINTTVTVVNHRRQKDGKIVEVSRSVQSTLWHALQGRGGNSESVARYMLAMCKLPMDTILTTLFSTGNFQLAMQQIKSCSSRFAADVREGTEEGVTALHRLAQVKSFDAAPKFASALADLLVKVGVDPFATSSKGWTVLHVASYHGHNSLVKHFVETHGLSVDILDKSGLSVLASMLKGAGISRALLLTIVDASKDRLSLVNGAVYGLRNKEVDDKWKIPVDMVAQLFDTPVEKRHALKDFVERLHTTTTNQKKNCKIQAKKTRFVTSTFLIEAVRNRNKWAAHYLLSNGADGAATDEDSRTALHHASLLEDSSMISLLLRWSPRIPIDALDSLGRTALSYACRALAYSLPESKRAPHQCLEALLGYGADPLLGEEVPLLLAIQSNQQKLAMAMLHSLVFPLAEVKEDSRTEVYSPGDKVWVRYGDKCGAWRKATVKSIDTNSGHLSVLPKGDKIDGVECTAIENVSSMWVKKVDKATDINLPLSDRGHPMVISSKNKGGYSNGYTCDQCKALSYSMRRWWCEESSCDYCFKCYPQWGCVGKDSRVSQTSSLSFGDAVGYIEREGDVGFALHIATVTTSHCNGTYDVQLAAPGLVFIEVSRERLIPLDDGLHLATTGTPNSVDWNNISITADLVHACVRPFDFGSYENLPLLQALFSAGAPVDVKNDQGKTPLDVVRPGSKIQAYLREVTKVRDGGRKVQPQRVIATDDIDLQTDSDAALVTLHNAGADITERIVPKVSSVCELDSAGVAVLADDCSSNGSYFDVALTKVDVEHGRYGKYVFYKMQIVHDPVQTVFVLLTNWGRIGENGKFQQTPFTLREKCVQEFGKVFKSKTGNKWESRETFQCMPGKYNLVQRPRTRLKHPEKLLHAVVESPSLPCSLPPDVANVLRYLLDADALTAAVSRCDFDQNRLPFGQLSLNTLQAAEAKLEEIKVTLNEQDKMPGGSSVSDFRSALEKVAKLSSEFYELLPMGDDIVTPFASNDTRIGKAVELIRVLRDLTITKQLVLGAMHRPMTNPLSYAYNALKVHIEPLASNSMERFCLQRYIDNTCSSGDVVVHQIYSIDDGRPTVTDIPNKRLLFHGSKNENIVGVLKHGLLIAPPAALPTGYMYGKGVYFADQFSKAFDYTSPCEKKGWDGNQPRSFVFVAEVSLGESHTALDPEYMEKPRAGTQSTHAIGTREPDSSGNLILDKLGVTVPLGPLHASTIPDEAENTWHENRWSELGHEISKKIEKIRLDPKTKFPKSLNVMHNNQNHKVTLENGPESATAKMQPVYIREKQENGSDCNEKDDGMKVGDCDDNSNSDERLFGYGDKQPAFSIYRKDQRRNHKPCSEYIVYDSQQVRLKYLIEVTSAEWVRNKYKLDKKRGEVLDAT